MGSLLQSSEQVSSSAADLDEIPSVGVPLVDLLVAAASHDHVLLVVIRMKSAPAKWQSPPMSSANSVMLFNI